MSEMQAILVEGTDCDGPQSGTESFVCAIVSESRSTRIRVRRMLDLRDEVSKHVRQRIP